MGNPMFLAGKEVEVRGAVERRMDKHMTVRGRASAARKKYEKV